MKTSELTGAALDWAVAKCEGLFVEYIDDGITRGLFTRSGSRFKPSISWPQGGPIIEREKISLEYFIDGGHEHGGEWLATRIEGPAVAEEYGPTPLIAAMRCFVASRLGDEVEVTQELI